MVAYIVFAVRGRYSHPYRGMFAPLPGHIRTRLNVPRNAISTTIQLLLVPLVMVQNYFPCMLYTSVFYL